MTHRRFVMLLLLVLALVSWGCASYLPEIRGTVVDDETGKPIEGAIVYVQRSRVGGFGDLHHMEGWDEEVLTDSGGRFLMSSPRVGNEYPEMAIYKPGYLGWNSRGIFDGTRAFDRNNPPWEWKTGQEYRLQRFKDGMSYIEHDSFMSWAVSGSPAIRKAMDEEEKQKRIQERDRGPWGWEKEMLERKAKEKAQ